jgi:hypothetical protein
MPQYSRVELLFEQENTSATFLDLFDISTLITKNRGINYKKSMI